MCTVYLFTILRAHIEDIKSLFPSCTRLHLQPLRCQVLGPGVKLEELQLDVLELSVVRKPQREVIMYTPKQAGDKKKSWLGNLRAGGGENL